MYNIFWTILNSSLRKFRRFRLLPFLKNPEFSTIQSFSDHDLNVCRSVKRSAMAENKFLLFPKVASVTSYPSLFFTRRIGNNLNTLKRNASTYQADRKEITEKETIGKNFNVPNEIPRVSPSQLYFVKEQSYNKNHLAFSLKQVKEKTPLTRVKLRYASDRTDFGKNESRIFTRTIAHKVNYGHNVLNFIKEDLLDVRTIKDKIKFDPKGVQKDTQKSADDSERPLVATKVADANTSRVSNSTAVLVVPEKLPAVQQTSLEDDELGWRS